MRSIERTALVHHSTRPYGAGLEGIYKGWSSWDVIPSWMLFGRFCSAVPDWSISELMVSDVINVVLIYRGFDRRDG